MNMSLLCRQLFSVSRSVAFASSRRQFTSDVKAKIDELLQDHKVVVFMKGVHGAPKCGFSNAVSMVLQMHGVEFHSVDVLSDEEIRQGIKDYTNWPTIPQVFINKEFVGGCDIILQMHQNGQLMETLKKAGITSALESVKNDGRE